MDGLVASHVAFRAGAEVMPNDAVIEIRNLVKRFEGQTVLDGINLDVHRGETLVVMGASGSGKSTLLRLLIGAIRPDEGRVRLLGRDLSELDEEGLNELRKKFGILFQSGALFNSMSVAENVALPLQEHTSLDRNIIDIQVKIKLELVGLREHADKLPAQLSGGMKKRAGLARALALDPQILFYDEPSAGLDPVTSAEIDELIRNLSRKLNVTSVVITHEMDSAFAVADRMAMIDKGRVLRVGTRDEFEALRDRAEETLDPVDPTERLIRQFLRGEATGPITERRTATGYAEDLLGFSTAPAAAPAVEPTRVLRS